MRYELNWTGEGRSQGKTRGRGRTRIEKNESIRKEAEKSEWTGRESEKKKEKRETQLRSTNKDIKGVEGKGKRTKQTIEHIHS